jgi:cytochrome c-type biogenesis protein
MGGASALAGGFSSFFSIWQLCILQISPFFVAFLVGSYLPTLAGRATPAVLRWTLPPWAAFTASFSVFYALLIASGLGPSRPIIANLGALRIVAAIVILAASAQLLLVDRVPALRRAHRPLVLSALAMLLGIAFALVYSPCITPMLSEIMGLATQRATATQGWMLAFWYAFGTCIALGLVSVALILVASGVAGIRRHAAGLTRACGVIVLALAVLNLTGLMTHYKAFALGFAL